MKNKILLLAAVMMIAGCQREEMQQARSYSAVTEGFEQSRTSLDEDNRVLWSAGDEIAIFENKDVPSRYQVSESSAGQSSAEFFLIEEAQSGTAAGADVAVYPYAESLTLSKMSTGAYRVRGLDVPEVQKYAGQSFDSGAFPMIAVSEAGSGRLAFKNICGVLRLYLTGESAVSSITVKGNNGELLSGPAVITAEHEAFPTMSSGTGAKEEVRLDCGAEGVMLDKNVPTPFSIVLPPVSFSQGFTVTVRSVDGAEMAIRTDKENPIRRSGVLNMPPVCFVPSVDDVTRVEIDALSMRFDGIDIRVKVTNVAEYAGGYKLKKDFDLAKVTREANWKTATRYTGPCMFEGPLNAFPSGQEGAALATGQTYVVWVAPYAEGVKSVKAEDIVYKEFTVPGVASGGSAVVSVLSVNAQLKSLEAVLHADGATVIYSAFLTVDEYAALTSEQDKVSYLFTNATPSSGDSMTLLKTGLQPDTPMVLLAVAVDAQGRYGALLEETYKTSVPVFNEDIVISLSVTNEKKEAEVKVSSVGDDVARYFYFSAKTSASSWTRMLGGSRVTAEEYMAVNHDSYIISNTDDTPFVDGCILLKDLEIGVEYVVVVMAQGYDGRVSRAYMTTFTPKMDLGNFVYRTGQTADLWRASCPSVTFGTCTSESEFYIINWAVTPAEGMTAYAVCTHPNSMTGYEEPEDMAVRVYNLGKEVVPGKMELMMYGDKENLVYVVWCDENGNYYEPYSVSVP